MNESVPRLQTRLKRFRVQVGAMPCNIQKLQVLHAVPNQFKRSLQTVDEWSMLEGPVGTMGLIQALERECMRGDPREEVSYRKNIADRGLSIIPRGKRRAFGLAHLAERNK